MERKFIKSGIPGLDALLGGGILEGSIITVSGPTGSGKSTLAAQFIYNGARESGEPGVYIAIEESRKDFFFHMGGFSFDFDGLEKDRKFVFLDYPVHEVDQIVNQSTAIYEIIRNTGARRVVIDSIMPIALYYHQDDERKKGFLKFIENLRKWNVTIMIISEDLKVTDQQGSPSSQYGIESFTDGWINLFYKYDERSMERKRYIEVIKMKGAEHSSKCVPTTIGGDGLVVGAVERPLPQATSERAVPVTVALMPPKPKPEEEDIDKLVETAFSAEQAPKPKARLPPAPAAQKKPEPKPVEEEEPSVPPILTRKLAASSIRPPPPPAAAPPPSAPKASPPKPPSAPAPKTAVSAAPRAPPAKPASSAPPKAAPKGKAQPKAPPAMKQPPKPSSSAAKPPPPKAPPPRVAKAPPPAPKALAQKPPAQTGARPPPAKMSDSIAERIAEAKKRIMKKGL